MEETIYDELLAQNDEPEEKYVLDTKTVDDILEEQYISNSFIVENLLGKGVYLFAGSPKVGKSFMMLQLAYSVSKGADFLGHCTTESDVLYLALEDTWSRLQKRYATMFGTDDNKRLHIAVDSGNLAKGQLMKQIENFIILHRETRLVIIDTLQKVREIQGDYNYSRDYADMSELKAFADSYEICILIVHHTRKMDSTDKFTMISGTNGLLGSADGAFVMYKNERIANSATIEISSRDVTDEKLKVTRNPDTLCWQLKETTAPLVPETPDELVKIIGDFITVDNPKYEGTATELVDDLNLTGAVSPNHLTRTLNVNVNELYDLYHICYASRKSNGLCRIKLLLDIEAVQGDKGDKGDTVT